MYLQARFEDLLRRFYHHEPLPFDFDNSSFNLFKMILVLALTCLWVYWFIMENLTIQDDLRFDFGPFQVASINYPHAKVMHLHQDWLHKFDIHLVQHKVEVLVEIHQAINFLSSPRVDHYVWFFGCRWAKVKIKSNYEIILRKPYLKLMLILIHLYQQMENLFCFCSLG